MPTRNLSLFIFLMLLFSCTQEKQIINITAQAEIMQEDPTSIAFFSAIAASSKILAEGEVDLETFHDITKKQGRDYCKMEKSIFNGDIQMEHFLEVQCQMVTTGKLFNKKYPFLKEIDKEDKEELFSLLVVKQDYNMDKVLEKHSKYSPED